MSTPDREPEPYDAILEALDATPRPPMTQTEADLIEQLERAASQGTERVEVHPDLLATAAGALRVLAAQSPVQPVLPNHPDDAHPHSWGCRRCGVDHPVQPVLSGLDEEAATMLREVARRRCFAHPEDREFREAYERFAALRRAATAPAADEGLRDRVEAVIATWEGEPVWTRPDVIRGLRAVLEDR